jgi:hypothetical protein
MCFSATASFITAAATGAIGVATVLRVDHPREMPLAAIPLIFSVQQVIEGMLWITLGNGMNPQLSSMLANVYIVIALLVWPVFAPFAAGLIEHERSRRLAIYALLLLGVALALFTAIAVVNAPYSAQIIGRSICYVSAAPYPSTGVAVYILCTCGTLLVSSSRFLRYLGMAVSAGLLISAAFYFFNFLSVWCFFAAASSAAIFLHFAPFRVRQPWPQSP